MDVEALTVCAIQNIDAVKSLTDEELAQECELPCGHGAVLLRDLLGTYRCRECGTGFWYSFLLGDDRASRLCLTLRGLPGMS